MLIAGYTVTLLENQHMYLYSQKALFSAEWLNRAWCDRSLKAWTESVGHSITRLLQLATAQPLNVTVR